MKAYEFTTFITIWFFPTNLSKSSQFCLKLTFLSLVQKKKKKAFCLTMKISYISTHTSVNLSNIKLVALNNYLFMTRPSDRIPLFFVGWSMIQPRTWCRCSVCPSVSASCSKKKKKVSSINISTKVFLFCDCYVKF